VPESAIFAGISLTVAIYSFIFLYPREWSRGLLINDEMWYAHLARNIYLGKGFVTNTLFPLQGGAGASFPTPAPFKQVGYPLVSAWAWMFTGPSPRAMLVIAIVAFALAAGLVYLVARRTGWGRPASLLVTGLVACNPSIISIEASATPEGLYLVFFLLAIWLILRPTPLNAVLAGICHTVLMLIKGHGIIYVPLFVAFLLLAPRRKRFLLTGSYAAAIVVSILVAALILPAHSVQMFEAGGNYALSFLIGTERSGANEVPYKEVHPPDAWEYIATHPADYAIKYVRMVSRTKFTLDGLGAPALSGILFPALLLSLLLFLVDLVLPGRLFPRAQPGAGAGRGGGDGGGGGSEGKTGRGDAAAAVRPDDMWIYLMYSVGIAGSFVFFWAIHLTVRFISHTFPLMLLLIFYVAWRMRPFLPSIKRELRTVLWVAAVLYFIVYPAASTLATAYRDPYAFIGRNLAVRFADYQEISATVREYVPPDAVLITDMSHEINWLNEMNTITFPLSEEDLRFLVEAYDVPALYEHPNKNRDWPWIPTVFKLVDDKNGRFWVRRDLLDRH
jgi:4-amino-4-deoxy-L-arabinose transferase-like glycosyltransferase